MFIIDKEQNKIEEIERKTFHELGFKERQNLQEWIAQKPECLGEELLIIQKEFDGFNDTNERLDLLALDKNGALVVIENKLDDTGRDVNWQALKYVSYCATLNTQQIIKIYQEYLDKYVPGKNAGNELVEFFDGKSIEEMTLNNVDQRIIFVAGNYRKEVTSTAMWMISHGISVQCFKATPYKHKEELLLDIEQIIPVKEAEEYMIKLADKAKEAQSVHTNNSAIMDLRKEYWTELLQRFSSKHQIFSNVNPTTDHWLSCGSGVSGVVFSFVATSVYASCEMTINIGSQEENKELFDNLKAMKENIEKDFGRALVWDRLDEKKSCRISVRLENVNVKNINDWDSMQAFHCKEMPRFYEALHGRLLKIKNR